MAMRRLVSPTARLRARAIGQVGAWGQRPSHPCFKRHSALPPPPPPAQTRGCASTAPPPSTGGEGGERPPSGPPAEVEIPGWVGEMRAQVKEKFDPSMGGAQLDIAIYDEDRFDVRPFDFHPQIWDALDIPKLERTRMCANDPERLYTLIGEGFAFPDSEDNPVVHSPENPALLWWDHTSPQPKVLIQLGPAFPPALWLAVKPQFEAVQNVFQEFVQVDAQNMYNNMSYFEELQASMEKKADEKLEDMNLYRMKNKVVEERRLVDPASIKPDWPNSTRLFLGVVDNFRDAEQSFMNNPFLFKWPICLGEENIHCQDSMVKTSIFRTVYSKSMVTIEAREDLAINAEDRDDHGEKYPAVEVPLFATVHYHSSPRISGGKGLVQRWNTLAEADYPLDVPVDVMATLIGNVSKGPGLMRFELEQLLERLGEMTAQGESVPQGDLLHLVTRVAMTISHLAVVGDPDFQAVYDMTKESEYSTIRISLAKGLAELGMLKELGEMMEREGEGEGGEVLGMIHLLHDKLSQNEEASRGKKLDVLDF